MKCEYGKVEGFLRNGGGVRMGRKRNNKCLKSGVIANYVQRQKKKKRVNEQINLRSQLRDESVCYNNVLNGFFKYVEYGWREQ